MSHVTSNTKNISCLSQKYFHVFLLRMLRVRLVIQSWSMDFLRSVDARKKWYLLEINKHFFPRNNFFCSLLLKAGTDQRYLSKTLNCSEKQKRELARHKSFFVLILWIICKTLKTTQMSDIIFVMKYVSAWLLLNSLFLLLVQQLRVLPRVQWHV